MSLTLIAVAAFASTLAGGSLALRLRDRLHLILGFSAGAVIGVAFFDLLPEAIAAGMGPGSQGPRDIIAWTAMGFFAYLVLDRILAFHGAGAHRGGVTAAVLCIHSVLDGVTIGLAFQMSRSSGLVVALAVLTHDFSDGINTMNVVLKNGGRRREAIRWLLLDAVAPAAGIAATFFFTMPVRAFSFALASFGGFFLYIGASDLIPESFHAHPKILTGVMTLLGAAVLYFAVTLLG